MRVEIQTKRRAANSNGQPISAMLSWILRIGPSGDNSKLPMLGYFLAYLFGAASFKGHGVQACGRERHVTMTIKPSKWAVEEEMRRACNLPTPKMQTQKQKKETRMMEGELDGGKEVLRIAWPMVLRPGNVTAYLSMHNCLSYSFIIICCRCTHKKRLIDIY